MPHSKVETVLMGDKGGIDVVEAGPMLPLAHKAPKEMAVSAVIGATTKD